MSSSKPKGAQTQPEAAGGLSPQQKAAAARKRNLEAKNRGGGESQNRQEANAAIERETKCLTTTLQAFGTVTDEARLSVMRYCINRWRMTPQQLFPEMSGNWNYERQAGGGDGGMQTGASGALQAGQQLGRQVTAG
jgi:hypothetical protein